MTTAAKAKAILISAVVAVSIAAPGAFAKSEKLASYSYDEVWPTAVRFLRVDEGFEITEKARDEGYVLFAVAEEGKVFRGALELVKTKDDRGRKSVRLVLTIEDRPDYMEQGILRRLDNKLRDELGDPGPPPPEPKPKPDDDGEDSKPE
jgi:hypothetical protein